MPGTYQAAIIGAGATIIGALLGAGGLRYIVEPLRATRRLAKVTATGLWLSSHELLQHLEFLKLTLVANVDDNDTRRSLRKIPKTDFNGEADWFVKEGYFCVITAYKIASFSSWMRIYQTSVLRADLIRKSDKYTAELFKRFHTFKVAASEDTKFWYNYIDAIGERLIIDDSDYRRPMGFADFCKQYAEDKQFLSFFEQLHMFIHFLGITDPKTRESYESTLTKMIEALSKIEQLVAGSDMNLLSQFRPNRLPYGG